MSCLIAQAIVFKDEFKEVDPQYSLWIMILAKLLGFTTTICFMTLGTYIVYYKAMIKVDTIVKIKGMAFYTMIVFIIIGTSHTILSIMCAILAESDSEMEFGKKRRTQALLSCIFEVLIQGLSFFCFFWAWTLSKRAMATIIKFHDYLVQYRLTPRSRILKKHLPKMTMVIEEGESELDKSSMMRSNSRYMSIS